MSEHARANMVRMSYHRLTSAALGHDLTEGEMVAWHAERLAALAKYMILFERHGDYETPGDQRAEGDGE